MIHFDPTIKLGDVLLIGGGIIAFVKMFFVMRDAIRDLTKAVGSKEPRDGLLGDMVAIKEEQEQHNAWLIEMRSKLGFKL